MHPVEPLDCLEEEDLMLTVFYDPEVIDLKALPAEQLESVFWLVAGCLPELLVKTQKEDMEFVAMDAASGLSSNLFGGSIFLLVLIKETPTFAQVQAASEPYLRHGLSAILEDVPGAPSASDIRSSLQMVE